QMSRMKSVYTLTALALLISAASLANAQGTSGTSSPASTAPATSTAPAKPASSTHHHSTSSKSAPKVDINSASKEELMKVPGIGDATADKIIAGRPFKSKSELESKGIMNKAEYQKATSHIVAHQEKAAASTEKK